MKLFRYSVLPSPKQITRESTFLRLLIFSSFDFAIVPDIGNRYNSFDLAKEILIIFSDFLDSHSMNLTTKFFEIPANIFHVFSKSWSTIQTHYQSIASLFVRSSFVW